MSKRSEATEGTHVRMKIIARYERHGVFAGTPALKVFRMMIAKAASQRQTEHGHRKVIAILDVAVAFFHANMEYVICRTSTSRSRARSHCHVVVDQASLRKAEKKAGWDAVVVEPNVYHKAGSLGEDDDVCVVRACTGTTSWWSRGCVSRRESNFGA